MPWLAIYAIADDFDAIRGWLGAEPDIAFVVSAGQGLWIAQPGVESLPAPRTCVWHVPSGPLPLLTAVRPADINPS